MHAIVRQIPQQGLTGLNLLSGYILHETVTNAVERKEILFPFFKWWMYVWPTCMQKYIPVFNSFCLISLLLESEEIPILSNGNEEYITKGCDCFFIVYEYVPQLFYPLERGCLRVLGFEQWLTRRGRFTSIIVCKQKSIVPSAILVFLFYLLQFLKPQSETLVSLYLVILYTLWN